MLQAQSSVIEYPGQYALNAKLPLGYLQRLVAQVSQTLFLCRQSRMFQMDLCNLQDRQARQALFPDRIHNTFEFPLPLLRTALSTILIRLRASLDFCTLEQMLSLRIVAQRPNCFYKNSIPPLTVFFRL